MWMVIGTWVKGWQTQDGQQRAGRARGLQPGQHGEFYIIRGITQIEDFCVSLDKSKKTERGGEKNDLTILAWESLRLVDPRMNIALLLHFRMQGIPNVTRRALGMLKRTVDSKQGVRSNDRNDERGPQPSLECPQKSSMGRGWVQVAKLRDRARVVSSGVDKKDIHRGS